MLATKKPAVQTKKMAQVILKKDEHNYALKVDGYMVLIIKIKCVHIFRNSLFQSSFVWYYLGIALTVFFKILTRSLVKNLMLPPARSGLPEGKFSELQRYRRNFVEWFFVLVFQLSGVRRSAKNAYIDSQENFLCNTLIFLGFHGWHFVGNSRIISTLILGFSCCYPIDDKSRSIDFAFNL